MPLITSSELVAYRAANVNDLGTNGGRMSAAAIVGGVVANVFPNIDESERAAGSTKYRKVFFKVDHPGNDKELLDSKLFMTQNSSGDDRIQFFPGTFTDTQSNLTGAERLYGCGALDANVTGGVSVSIDVQVEPGVTGLFADGDSIRISDKASLGLAIRNEEYLTISGAPVQVGDIVTIPLAAAPSNSYSAIDTVVSSVYTHGSLQPTHSAVVVASGATGTYNATDNLLLHNQGTVEQTWTLTFTSATAFNIVGDQLGPVGSGSVSLGAAPTNASFGAPYFTLGSAGFGGAYQAGDTITFTTHPAAAPMWLKRTVPAGATVSEASTAKIAFIGGTT